MKIATAAYPIDWLETWQAYQDKLGAWVETAQADLLVFPEYGAMELASLAGAEVAGDLQAATKAISDMIPAVDELHASLARIHGCHILAASAPVVTERGMVNRARLFTPEGQIGVQDKQIMTRYERDPWGVRPGGPLRVFDTALGKIGVLICYDSEFPLLGRALVEAGAELLLVPSCTETEAGWTRVKVGAMARALEGQCVTVQSPTIGEAPWMPAVDANYGAAAIYGPPDKGFPASGVLAHGKVNEAGWVRAEVDLNAVRAVRADGHVLNMTHWAEQEGRLGCEVQGLV